MTDPRRNGHDSIKVTGARTHNLKNVTVTIPRDRVVAVTGVSGSGKSSLCFDTIYAEAHRRQLQSMSGMARQLVGDLERPDADQISGVTPALALKQDLVNTSPRSTVGTSTDIYSLFRVLLAAAGEPACVTCATPLAMTHQSWMCPTGHDTPLPDLNAAAFSFNSPIGACPACAGLGHGTEIDPGLVIPDTSLTLNEGVLAPWRGSLQEPDRLVACQVAADHGGGADVPWSELPDVAQEHILYANALPVTVTLGSRARETTYTGVFPWIRNRLASGSQAKQALAYTRAGWCDACAGSRLNSAQAAVRLGNIPLSELVHVEFEQLLSNPALTSTPTDATHAVVEELHAKIKAQVAIGLGYLTMARATPTLSGGEAQRLRLATQLSTDLAGMTYALDEPSAGLHPDDVEPLIVAMHGLRDRGNTVLVVDHDLDVISAADWVVELGPAAGHAGGHVVFTGPAAQHREADTATARALRTNRPTREPAPLDDEHRYVTLKGARGQNLAHVDLLIPHGRFTAVTGRSGSGKTTLVARTLFPAAAVALGQKIDTETEPFASINGLTGLDAAAMIDQAPIGRNRRSNAATYVGAFEPIRTLFAGTPTAKARKLKPSHFAFNSAGGRCEDCKGEGAVPVELSFLPAAAVTCTTCQGRRFQADILGITWQGRSIADVLDLPVDDALTLFEGQKRIEPKLAALSALGLGYLPLGQPAPTLSGGEAQRVKLATELGKPASGKTLYVVDEPTRGLHPSDVERVLDALVSLTTAGHTVVVITHDPTITHVADWRVELGPGGGHNGGKVLYQGPPGPNPKGSPKP